VRLIRASASAVAILAAALCAFPLSHLGAQEAVAHSRFTLTGTAHSYDVGDSSVSERVANARYELYVSRIHIQLDASTLQFVAPFDTIRGRLPVGARVSYTLRAGDTISVFARSSSDPLALSSRQTAALSTAGTSTVDLESAGFGTPSVGGGRIAVAFPVGDIVLGARAGIENEPMPNGASPVYWQGTTVRGGLALTKSAGDGSITASLDVTHSSADSLGGRNLFPGGGSITLQVMSDLSVPNPFDPLEDEQWPLRVVAFYGRPYGNDRADQPNLLIPQGDLAGALGTLLVTIGDLAFSPSLQFLRETSSSGSTSGIVTSRITGSAWTAQSSLDVTIPLGRVFELTPQAGYTFGNVGASFSQAAVLRRGRGVARSTAFNDDIRGSWLSLQLTAVF
jgi:hypothetical protein